MRADVEAAWSENDKGVRYGVFFNNHQQGNFHDETIDLQLVVVGPEGAHLVNLKPAADAAIKAYLRKRNPKDAARYVWICAFHVVDNEGHEAFPLFKGRTLSLPFAATMRQENQKHGRGPGELRLAARYRDRHGQRPCAQKMTIAMRGSFAC